MLNAEVARCEGQSAGASGHQVRVDCVECERRLAPRAGYELIDPPKDWPCPKRIPAVAWGWRKQA